MDTGYEIRNTQYETASACPPSCECRTNCLLALASLNGNGDFIYSQWNAFKQTQTLNFSPSNRTVHP